MPSHISHALLAEDLLAGLSRSSAHPPNVLQRADSSVDLREALRLGAQGPDLFLHNHRRTPRGFRFGAILHRKGNDEMAAALLEEALSAPVDPNGELLSRAEVAAYALGYISHVWFDRIAHPYVNARAGWRGTPDRDPDRPAMHAFLERIIDVQLLRHLRGMSVGEYRFASVLPDPGRAVTYYGALLTRAVRFALKSAADDPQLGVRVGNALEDALSFYRYTDAPSHDYFLVARAAELRGEVGRRWLSLVHPQESLLPWDALNLRHDPWPHPCRPAETFRDSVPELYAAAHESSHRTATIWLEALDRVLSSESVELRRDRRAEAMQQIRASVGSANLNDGSTGDPPCHRRVVAPLPLLELYVAIKAHYG